MIIYILAPLMILLTIIVTTAILSDKTESLLIRIITAIAVNVVTFLCFCTTSLNNVLDFLINLTS